MANAVLMPKAGISVESCIIGSWRKRAGEPVALGEVLFDYETDKASFECESTAEGILLEIFAQNGDEVPCLTAVCAVGQPGEDVTVLRPGNGSPAAQAPVAPAAEAPPVPAPASGPHDGQKASPRARAEARRLGVDLAPAVPTGPYGRVIARDVEALAQSAKTGAGIGGRSFEGVLPAAGSSPAVSQEGYTDVQFSGIRRSIAKAMKESLDSTAQLTHHHSFDAGQIMALRAMFKAQGGGLGLEGVSLNDIILYAVSRTLMQHPDLNAHLVGGDTLRKFSGVHLGVAVDTPRGLMVPTIFDAGQKSLAQISREAKELAGLCKTGSISPDLLRGGTFTVSNLGATGVEMFTPIINPPQVAILGVCGITTRVKQGEEAGNVVAYPCMGLSLTYDHRAVDGAPASRFAQQLCRNLEQFQLMLAL